MAVELRTNVDWETFTRLDGELATGSVRLTYFQRNLNRLISDLFENLAVGLDIDFSNAGGTTHLDESSQTGFEPDTCFYVTNLDYPFPPGPIELPAPDLIIEVGILRSSLNKMAAYAAVGCPEGWRHHNGRLSISALPPGRVKAVNESAVLPGVTVEDLNLLLAKADEMPRQRWALFVIDWARSRKG